jgi:large subunit ribosomal protein L17
MFSRKFNARKALLRGLIVSLVEHGRIRTTVTKAKELRRHVEPAITLGKEDTVAIRRLLMSRIPNEDTVTKLVTDIGPRFKSRPGGYTRIIKLDRRPGDKTEMAFIEFVDYDYTKATKDVTEAPKKTAKKAKAGEKDAAPAKARKVAPAVTPAMARKARRKMQNKSRAESRA